MPGGEHQDSCLKNPDLQCCRMGEYAESKGGVITNDGIAPDTTDQCADSGWYRVVMEHESEAWG